MLTARLEGKDLELESIREDGADMLQKVGGALTFCCVLSHCICFFSFFRSSFAAYVYLDESWLVRARHWSGEGGGQEISLETSVMELDSSLRSEDELDRVHCSCKKVVLKTGRHH